MTACVQSHLSYSHAGICSSVFYRSLRAVIALTIEQKHHSGDKWTLVLFDPKPSPFVCTNKTQIGSNSVMVIQF